MHAFRDPFKLFRTKLFPEESSKPTTIVSSRKLEYTSGTTVDYFLEDQDTYFLVDLLVRHRYLMNLKNTSSDSKINEEINNLSVLANDKLCIKDLGKLIADIDLSIVLQRRVERHQKNVGNNNQELHDIKALQVQLKQRLDVNYTGKSSTIDVDTKRISGVQVCFRF